MLNPRKTSPALYELIGRQTRVMSGKQIGGRGPMDADDDGADTRSHHASAHTGAPAVRPAPAPAPRPRYTPADADHTETDHHSPPPLRVARMPVHAPAPPGAHRERAQTPEPESAPAPNGAALGPGRAVRVPTGYLLFGLAAVLAALIGGYMFGYVKKAGEVNEAERQAVQRSGPILTEPLGDERPAQRSQPQPLPKSTPKQSGTTDSGTKSTQAPAKNAPTKAKPGVIVVEKGIADPREPGKNYAIVASLGRERAIELAEFLAAAGVESAVLPRNNLGLYPVVSLTGFTKEEFKAGAEREHESRLRELGKQFAKQGGGRRDFYDLLWSKHSG